MWRSLFKTNDKCFKNYQLNEIRDQIVLLADDHSVNLAFSYGVCYGTESTDLQRMIEIADYKMYENKRKRKGR